MWSIGHTPRLLDRMRSADAAVGGPAAAWVAARDAVLRGLVHALSNRVGTVAAASALLEAGSAETAGRVLGGEVERLEALLALFRAATADPFGAGATEPLICAEVVGEALALHAHAGDAGSARVPQSGVDGAPPVLAPRAALLHALLVLIAGAAEGAVLRADADASVVRLRFDPPSGPEAAAGAAWLLAGSGAEVDGEGVVALPRLGAPGAPR